MSQSFLIFSSWLLGLVLFLPIPSFSANNEVIQLTEQAEKLNLANHTTWLKLLHYEGTSLEKTSAIQSKRFFLSPLGQTSPEDELEAKKPSYHPQTMTTLELEKEGNSDKEPVNKNTEKD